MPERKANSISNAQGSADAKSEEPSEDIAIVGGGIAGLFCAYILAQHNKSVWLFEASKRLGGRIRTLRLDKDNKELHSSTWKKATLEFYAEFGPMRIELEVQLLLKALLTELGITDKPAKSQTTDEPYLKPFPAYSSPTSAHDPQYELRPDETGKAPLELLRMALLKIIARLEVSPNSAFGRKQQALLNRITAATAFHEPADPLFTEWMKRLGPDDYLEIQIHGQIDEVPLYTMGFWNLISDHLSQDAVTKLRDLGTFYHLLPENPNAAEWLVWWLMGFATSEQMQGVFGGMECIVDRLIGKLAQKQLRLGNGLFINCRVTELVKAKGKLKLVFDKDKSPKGEGDSTKLAGRTYDRVILALPKSPLEKIVQKNKDAFQPESEIEGLLDSAFGFPMVKMFVVVKKRWWEEDRPNLYATRVPTRELYYWKGLAKDSTQGLIMAYTDRPASSFWANYVPPGEQLDAARPEGGPLTADLQKRLTTKVVQYLKENNAPGITAEDIVWYGIRDWGREPYAGANHAWRPERKYWVVMRRLADISGSAAGAGLPSIHICGEAYSDYHGFMEGSLRSAVYALHRILDRGKRGKFKPLTWLHEENSGKKAAGLRVNRKYLESLRSWAKTLDALTKDKYL
jgi:hypothetical protein